MYCISCYTVFETERERQASSVMSVVCDTEDRVMSANMTETWVKLKFGTKYRTRRYHAVRMPVVSCLPCRTHKSHVRPNAGHALFSSERSEIVCWDIDRYHMNGVVNPLRNTGIEKNRIVFEFTTVR